VEYFWYVDVIIVLGSDAKNFAQCLPFAVCVPDYSVGVMPFFIAKQNGYFAQMDVDVIAGKR